MRIFPALCRYRMPGGNIFRGKYKIVFPATAKDVSNLKYDFEIEEKNMFYLRHPYLTPASIQMPFPLPMSLIKYLVGCLGAIGRPRTGSGEEGKTQHYDLHRESEAVLRWRYHRATLRGGQKARGVGLK